MNAADALDKLCGNLGTVNDMSEAEVRKLRETFSFYHGPVDHKDSYAAMSIVNWPVEWYRKFYLTAAMCFISRLATEFTPELEIHLEDKKLADGKITKEEHDKRVKDMTAVSRNIVRRFVNSAFSFDPDRHVREAHHKDKIKTAEDIEKLRASFNPKDTLPPKKDLYSKEQLQHCASRLAKMSDVMMQNLNALEKWSTTNGMLDYAGIFLKQYKAIYEVHSELEAQRKYYTAGELYPGLSLTPSADLFHNFGRYVDNNFEDLNNVMRALYLYREDIEYSIHLYEIGTKEQLAEYCETHAKEFRLEPITVKAGQITLLGPYKQNRDAVQLYNENTELLKNLSKQQSMDEKLAKDIMMKKRDRKKKENIDVYGVDAKGLAEYSSICNNLTSITSKDTAQMTREEQEEYQRLSRAKAKYEESIKCDEARKKVKAFDATGYTHLTPAEKEEYNRLKQQIDYAETADDAICADVFYTNEDGELKRDIIYTQAEAPYHLNPNSKYVGEYQPIREPGERLDKYKD